MLLHAFEMQCDCIRDVHERARRMVHTPAGTPVAYTVRLGDLPPESLEPRRNLFSTLFLAVYEVLDLPLERRRLYGVVNQLFRSWVTSADNLLDAEDKVVLPIRLHGGSRVMREVVALMAADRVLFDVLRGAEERGVVRADEARCISERTLQVLLPSAGQEASEEEGVTERPDAETVLESIHRFKTGLLFHLPFLGPESIDRLDPSLLANLKAGLLDFGLGCQLLDDTRDMARDYLEHRHNYLLSHLAHRHPDIYRALASRDMTVEDRLYLHVPDLAAETVRRAYTLLTRGLITLGQNGFDLPLPVAAAMARYMFFLLDLRDMTHACSD